LGADSFIAFYGLRYTLTNSELDAVSSRTDERVVAARRERLRTHFGRLTDGEPYFLFVGMPLGVFGLQGDSERSYDWDELEQLKADTATKLAAAGLQGTPQLHLQLEAQY
jgi:hypothetical protein